MEKTGLRVQLDLRLFNVTHSSGKSVKVQSTFSVSIEYNEIKSNVHGYNDPRNLGIEQ